MIKTFCDIDGKEIQPGELIATYEVMDRNYMQLKTQPVVKRYIICATCKVAFNNLIEERLKK